MSVGSDGYNVVLVLHVLCAIVGFGAVMLNGLYAAQAKRRPGPGGLAILEANLTVTKVGEYFIYAVFVLGFALVGMSDKVWSFSQTWIWVSVVLYVVGIGVAHGVVYPNAKRINALVAEVSAGSPGAGGPPPQAEEIQRRGKTLGAATGFLDLVLVAILALMVWKPL